MTPLRVTHVCRTAPPAIGGLEASVGGLTRALRDRGHEVRLVTLRADRGPPRLDGIEVIEVPAVGPRRYPFGVGLGRVVREGRPHLVHVHGIDGLLDQLLAGRGRIGAPVGVSTHGGYLHTPAWRRTKRLWLRTGTRWALSRVDRVWLTSDADRLALAAARPPVDAAVMPDGVDVDRFARVVRRPEPGLIGVVGRVDVHKGLDDLIDALPRVPGVRVEIVGPEGVPGLAAALTSRAAARGVADRVRFAGPATGEDLVRFLGRPDRVVLPSRYEGFGIAAVEVMAARVPLVLADIPAFRAHAGGDGVRARVVSFRAPATGGADALRAALTEDVDLARVDRAAAYAEQFSWGARAAAWEEAYRALLDAGRRGRTA